MFRIQLVSVALRVIAEAYMQSFSVFVQLGNKLIIIVKVIFIFHA